MSKLIICREIIYKEPRCGYDECMLEECTLKYEPLPTNLQIIEKTLLEYLLRESKEAPKDKNDIPYNKALRDMKKKIKKLIKEIEK